jgi:hypothetical protein
LASIARSSMYKKLFLIVNLLLHPKRAIHLPKLRCYLSPALRQIFPIMRTHPTKHGAFTIFGAVKMLWVVSPARTLHPLEEGVLSRHATKHLIPILDSEITRSKSTSGSPQVVPSWGI